MLIYEVNITIDPSTRESFIVWLKAHIVEMLKIEGFKSADLWSQESSNDITVHYHVTSKELLQKYFDELAPKMRQQGITKFEDKMKIQRRILLPL